ncbi:MAG: hypothetical protein ACKOPQ_12535 [Novosphingobium sp.]|jgi:hypothetical protein
MAFSDSKFWQVDLTTRAGAKTGAYQASIVCLLMAVLSFLGLIFLGMGAGVGSLPATVLLLQSAQFVLFLVAGWQLRSGKGFYLGVVALALLVLNLAGNVVSGAIGGAILNGVLILVLGNGLRGAKALMDNRGFEDDQLDVFN